MGKGWAKEEKRSQLPFFPAKRQNNRHKNYPQIFNPKNSIYVI
jgi:hypothetical protein